MNMEDSDLIMELLVRERDTLAGRLAHDLKIWGASHTEPPPWFDRSKNVADRRAAIARIEAEIERRGP